MVVIHNRCLCSESIYQSIHVFIQSAGQILSNLETVDSTLKKSIHEQWRTSSNNKGGQIGAEQTF